VADQEARPIRTGIRESRSNATFGIQLLTKPAPAKAPPLLWQTRSNAVGASYPLRTRAEAARLRCHPGLHEKRAFGMATRLAALGRPVTETRLHGSSILKSPS
jgi:hypothetical protein